DPILKERLFGLTGPEGNHGEDVKELYYYLDATPTGSYLKGLYKYPQAAYPYEWLVEENRRRGKLELEFELIDTGVFAADRYFDVPTQYAKNAPDDIFIRITVTNCGPARATLHVLPQLWFRNTWSWGETFEYKGSERPRIFGSDGTGKVTASHPTLGRYILSAGLDLTARFRKRSLPKTKLISFGSTALRRAKPTTRKMRSTVTWSTRSWAQ